MKKANYANRISAAVCALLLLIAAAVAALVAKPVGAVAEEAVDIAEYADKIVKAEDLVDELTDEELFNTRSKISVSVLPENTPSDSAGYLDTEKDYNTSAATDMFVYSKKATAENGEKNANGYDGNLAVYVGSTSNWNESSIGIKQAAVNTLISYRMLFKPVGGSSDNGNYLFSLTTAKPGNYSGVRWLHGYVWCFIGHDDNMTLRVTYVDNKRAFQDTDPTITPETTFTKEQLGGAEGKDVIITYGVIEDNGVRNLYFEMKDASSGEEIVKSAVSDSGFEYSEPGAGNAGGKPDLSQPGWFAFGSTIKSLKTYIGGVDGPLVNEVTEDVAYEDSGDDELTLADYKLPDGYTWENPDEKITSLAPRTYRAYKDERYFGSDKTYYNVTVDAGEKLIAHSTVNAEDLVDDIGDDALAAKDKIAVLGTNTSDFTGVSYEDDKGNLSISFKEQNWKEVGVAFKQTEEAKNKLISFRFKYDPKGARTTQYYVFSWTAALPERAYLKNIENNYSWWFVNDSTLRLVCITENSSSTSMENETNRVAEYTVTGMPTDATDMIVTYGILADENDKRTVYINLRGTDGKEYINYAYDDSAYDYPAGSKPLKPSLENGGWYSFGKCQNITSLTWNTYIGGIKEPLVNKGEYFDFTLDGGDCKEEQKLSEVSLSGHEGYSWKEGDSQLSAGTHAYPATYAYDYYGNSLTVDCEITVTATTIYTNSATAKFWCGDIKAADDKTVSWKDGEAGRSIALPDIDTNMLFGTAIGWKAQDGNLYKQGDSVSVNEVGEIEFALADLDFGVVDGSARVTKAGGAFKMTFTVRISKSQYAFVEDKISLKYVYAEANELTADTFKAESGGVTSGTIEESDLFDLDRWFYGARVTVETTSPAAGYAVRTYITVQYASGEEDVYSPYDESGYAECALTAAKRTILETADEGVKAEIRAAFLGKVVEVVDRGDGSFAVVTYEDGFDGGDYAREYTLTGGEASEGTLTLVLDGMTFDGESVCVVVYKNIAGGYTRTVYTGTVAAGTVTVGGYPTVG